jgi:hypothetical protein
LAQAQVKLLCSFPLGQAAFNDATNDLEAVQLLGAHGQGFLATHVDLREG